VLAPLTKPMSSRPEVITLYSLIKKDRQITDKRITVFSETFVYWPDLIEINSLRIIGTQIKKLSEFFKHLIKYLEKNIETLHCKRHSFKQYKVYLRNSKYVILECRASAAFKKSS
jgi:hypothetical protein